MPSCHTVGLPNFDALVTLITASVLRGARLYDPCACAAYALSLFVQLANLCKFASHLAVDLLNKKTS